MQLPTDIDAYIPHRGAMRLIDRVLEVDARVRRGRGRRADDGLFVRDGRVPAWIGIEYMAQASRPGPAPARAEGARRAIGFLLGTAATDQCRPSERALPAGRGALRADGANGLGQFACRILAWTASDVAARIVSVFDPPKAMATLLQGEA
jgi:predicted hotdog family 3-hydroxylacyl-ACP dehydratase